MEVEVCNCLTREEKKLILANHEKGKSYSEIAGIVRLSARSQPSPPLYPHFNRPSGFWPCVKSCLVGGSDKYTAFVRRWKNVVYRVISRYKADMTSEPKPKTDRPPMTTKREDQMIVKMSLKDCFDTAKSISRTFCEQTESQSKKELFLEGLTREN